MPVRTFGRRERPKSAQGRLERVLTGIPRTPLRLEAENFCLHKKTISPYDQASNHSDRLRDWPLDAGATIEANPFEKVPTPAKTRLCFREMSDQAATLMDLVMLSLLCGVSD